MLESWKSRILTGLAVFVALLCMAFWGALFEGVDAEEILVVQSVRGKITCHVDPGSFKWQGFGKVTKYPKRAIYDFSEGAVPIRFNEGGRAGIDGTIQWEMPLDCENITTLHTRFASAEAIATQLIRVVADKAVYMTGPLLSSTESYAERRADMIFWVDDQIQNGTYRTRQRDVQVIDPLTGEETTETLVEIQEDAAGNPQRQEAAQLTAFGIRAFNFAVNEIDYAEEVDAQIQAQQQNIMRVRTAMAAAREAEQRAITIEQQGLASAAEAKWEQEVLKATEVTAAQQRLEVAQLDRAAAEEYRQEQILIGQGDGERRRLAMAADGALDQRLEALKEINRVWAAAIGDKALVPNVVMGGTNGGQGSAMDFINLMMVQLAQQVGTSTSP
jgi:hypothetical protein